MATEYRVTQEMVDDVLATSQKQEFVVWRKIVIICFLLPNGFSIVGCGACVDPENFDIEIGRKVAYDDAANQLWPLLGYQVQERLAASQSAKS